jgi:hypothetical protein
MHELSPLYCRYNGFTLGAFLETARLPFARRRYGGHRRRMQEFLDELGIEAALPGTHTRFVGEFDRLQQIVLEGASGRSPMLRDFIGLGMMSVLHSGSGSLVTDAHRRILRERWVPVLQRYGVRKEAYDDWLRVLPQDRRLVVEDVLTPASVLLTTTLEPLELEPDTCFVAMPFEPPFTDYFTEFYGPALARAGYRAIRAWGGLSSEEYYILLLTLISRCGCMLAELSTLNLNVVNEIGIAHGGAKTVFMIGNRSLKRLPSNLAHLPNLTYSRHGHYWLTRAIAQLADFVTWMQQSRQRTADPQES